MTASFDWSTFLGETYNAFFVLGGLVGAIVAVFKSHKRYVEHKNEIQDTKETVVALGKRLDNQDEVLASIKKQLTMNGKNTRNPGDLLGLICDKLGIPIPE